MAENFFQKLRDYYQNIAHALRGEAKPASIFPNATDIGTSRELIYKEFLKSHVPKKCKICLGGFVFGNDGSVSKQLDIIITTDTTPNFDFNNKDDNGKSFSPVDGTLGVISIKSTLNKNELEDTLNGLATIPTLSQNIKINPLLRLKNYEDWPLKVLYSTDGISADSLLEHINNYYINHPQIPITRRPNLIHVSGKYLIVRAIHEFSVCDKTTLKDNDSAIGEYTLITSDPDVQGIVIILYMLQLRASISTQIHYSSHGDWINQVLQAASSHSNG